MKLILEEELKEMLHNKKPSVFYVPQGRILSPAAKDYLNRERIGIGMERDGEKAPEKKVYYDYATGAVYESKPEYMTHMYGNRLVRKDAPMICYRGKLDRLQAEIVLAESVIAGEPGKTGMLKDLDEILHTARELMRCELMGQTVQIKTILGLTMEELREHSHHSEKYYKVNTMEQPHYSKGVGYAYLNLIRTSVRETEILAVRAFQDGAQENQKDILELLNRLSSAMHIMMCKCAAGMYDG